MAKIIFILGLAGSGKSHQAIEIQKQTGAKPFENIWGDRNSNNISNRNAMLKHLKEGKDCTVEEIALCIEANRKEFDKEYLHSIPNLIIDWICFENNKDKANWNVERRNDKGKEDIKGHLEINEYYHKLYTYPKGVEPILIHLINS